MTNVEALKQLYVKLGGEAATVADMTTIADVIAEINKIVENGGGSGLPEYGDSDIGKFLALGVSGPQWATGANGVAFVTVNESTYAEVTALSAAGKYVVAKTSNGYSLPPCNKAQTSFFGYGGAVVTPGEPTGKVVFKRFSVAPNGNWYEETYTVAFDNSTE